MKYIEKLIRKEKEVHLFSKMEEILERHREDMKPIVEEAQALGINYEKYMEKE